ncbi:MAG: hypothetical protein LAO18_11625, partial [Acidobacteriia bacterium]|nr:hypothetical protein [Terriglobia bacterium]
MKRLVHAQHEILQKESPSLRTLWHFFANFAVKAPDREGRKGLAKGGKVGLIGLLCLASLPMCMAGSSVQEEQIDHILPGSNQTAAPAPPCSSSRTEASCSSVDTA